MSRDRAAYMREYRARQKAREGILIGDLIGTDADLDAANERIRELEEEIRHLKAELAKRPLRTHTGHRDGNPGAASDRFNTRPFTPVPKHR